MPGKGNSKGSGWYNEPRNHALAAKGISVRNRPPRKGEVIKLSKPPSSLSPKVINDLQAMNLATAEYLEDLEDKKMADALENELVAAGVLDTLKDAGSAVVGGIGSAASRVSSAISSARDPDVKAAKEEAKAAKKAAKAEAKAAKELATEKKIEAKTAEKVAKDSGPITAITKAGQAKAEERLAIAKAAEQLPAKQDSTRRGRPPSTSNADKRKKEKQRSRDATSPYTGTRDSKDQISTPSASARDIDYDEYTRYMMGQEVDVDVIENIVDNKKRLIDLSRSLQADAKSIKAYAEQLDSEYDIVDNNEKARWKDENDFAWARFKEGWEGVSLDDPGIKIAYNEAKRALEEEQALKKEAIKADIKQHEIDVQFVKDKSEDFMKTAQGVRNRAMIG